MNMTITAGMILRRGVRRSLDSAGIPYREDKGLLDSQFVLTVTTEQRRAVIKWIDANNID